VGTTRTPAEDALDVLLLHLEAVTVAHSRLEQHANRERQLGYAFIESVSKQANKPTSQPANKPTRDSMRFDSMRFDAEREAITMDEHVPTRASFNSGKL